MPIDEAMIHELADDWFPPFLDAQRMSPSHPLRQQAFEDAERNVMDSYGDLEFTDMVPPYDDPKALTAIAEDVIQILRGVAAYVVAAESSAQGGTQ